MLCLHWYWIDWRIGEIWPAYREMLFYCKNSISYRILELGLQFLKDTPRTRTSHFPIQAVSRANKDFANVSIYGVLLTELNQHQCVIILSKPTS